MRESGSIQYLKIAEHLPFAVANQKEIEEISKWKRKRDGGILCNLTLGGEGWNGNHTPLSKIKMSRLAKSPQRLSTATNNVQKAIQKNTGWRKLERFHSKIIQDYESKCLTEVQKKYGVCFQTLQKYLKEKGIFVANKNRKDTEEVRKKKSIANRGKASRPVNQYSLDGSFLKAWSNMSSACEFLGKPNRQGDICTCCLGKQKTAFGYKWKYK